MVNKVIFLNAINNHFILKGKCAHHVLHYNCIIMSHHVLVAQSTGPCSCRAMTSAYKNGGRISGWLCETNV